MGLGVDGGVSIFLGRAGGGFAAEQSPELAGAIAPQNHCAGYHAELVDLDGDGRDEIVAGFAGEPGSEQFAFQGGLSCTTRGALRAWKLAPAQ